MNSTTSLASGSPSVRMKLNSKTGIVSGFLLIIGGLFAAGIQVYIFAAFSDYGDGNVGQTWTDAYNGLAIASGAVDILIGSINIAIFSLKNNSHGRLTAVVLVTTLGALGSAASTVLTAIESDYLNFPRHPGSGHPCEDKANSHLTDKQCTDWLALEVTVSVLSGLAFCSYFILIYQLSLGLANEKPNAKKMIAEEQKAIAEKYNTSNRPPSEAFMGNAGPYEAFEKGEDDLNPRYKYHLQQITLQQRAVDEMLTANYKRPPHATTPSTPVILSSSVSVSSQRGQTNFGSNQEHYYSPYQTQLPRPTTRTAKPVTIPIPPQTPNNQPSYLNRY